MAPRMQLEVREGDRFVEAANRVRVWIVSEERRDGVFLLVNDRKSSLFRTATLEKLSDDQHYLKI